MKRSGRSVAAASRVIEMDEVLEATIAVGLEARHEPLEDVALHVLALGRGLDHEVAVAERIEPGRGRDERERRLSLLLRDLAALGLAAEIAVDRLDRARQGLGVDVVQDDAASRQRRDMGDAAAHLARAYDAHGFDFLAHRLPSLRFASSASSAGTIWKRSPTSP